MYITSDNRFGTLRYNRVGRSGLQLLAISLGKWYNFGDPDVFENARVIARRAFNLGVTHCCNWT